MFQMNLKILKFFVLQVNTSNLGNIVRELFQENIVRGRLGHHFNDSHTYH